LYKGEKFSGRETSDEIKKQKTAHEVTLGKKCRQGEEKKRTREDLWCHEKKTKAILRKEATTGRENLQKTQRKNRGVQV